MGVLEGLTISALISVNVAFEDLDKRVAFTVITLTVYSFLLLIGQYNV